MSKLLGVLGGLGPESTLDYYKRLVDGYRRRVDDGSYPRIVIHSVDLKPLADGFAAGELGQVTDHLVQGIQVLEKAGADFGLISANTPHLVFDEVARRTALPLVSIVEAACRGAKQRGKKRLGLFGTRFTMQGRFYPDVFEREGIALVVPSDDEQAWIHEKYIGELIVGEFRPETHDRLLAIVEAVRKRHGIDGLLLAGTELPLILREKAYAGVEFLDTTGIHVERALELLFDPAYPARGKRGGDLS